MMVDTETELMDRRRFGIKRCDVLQVGGGEEEEGRVERPSPA